MKSAHKHAWRGGLALLWGLLGAAPAAALSEAGRARLETLREMDLERLLAVEIMVSSASKFEQPLLRAPASVTVVSAREIQQHGYRSLGEILESVRSFDLNDDRLYQFAGVRGFSRSGDFASRLLVLLDGQRLNDNVYENTPLGLDFILDVDLIERVEVVRGPVSSLYGPNAIFGIVNVITRHGGDLEGGEVKLGAHSDRRYQGRASFGQSLGARGQVLVSASLQDYPGDNLYFPEYDAPATHHGVAERRDAERVHSALFKLNYDHFHFSAAHVERVKGAGYGYDNTLFDSATQLEDRRSYLNLGYNRRLSGDWQLSADLGYHHMGFFGTYLYPNSKRDLAQAVDTNHSDSAGRWWLGEVSLARAWNRHQAIVGLEYQYNQTQQRLNYYRQPYQLATRAPLQNRYRWALYAQDDILLGPRLSLSLNLRYDAYPNSDPTLSPRLALIYQPSPSTALKLLYGRAFRSPTSFELSYADPAAAAQDAEHIHSSELSLEHRLHRDLRGVVSLYHYRLDNILAWQERDSVWWVANSAEFRASGLEFGLQGGLGHWSGRASYAYQDASPSAPVPTHAPAHLLKFNLSYALSRDYSLGWRSYFSSRRPSGDPAAPSLDAYSVSHASLLARPWGGKTPQLALHLYNVFDQDYGAVVDASVYALREMPQPGRRLSLELAHRF